jgi:hypothetical protein
MYIAYVHKNARIQNITNSVEMVFNLTESFILERSHMFRFHFKKYIRSEIKNMSM